MNATVELTPYQQLGGNTPLRQLVDRFYDVMLSEPSVETVRDMHRADTTQIRERLFDFLSGWLGGPSRFIEKHGHPRLRMRHRFFQIGEAERDQWMLCMRQALAEITMDATLRVRLEQAIMQMAEMLRNDAPRTCDGGGFGCSALTPEGERCGR